MKKESTSSLLEKGFSRFRWASEYKFALGPLGQESTDHPRKGKVPPRDIDKHLHQTKNNQQSNKATKITS